MKRAAKLVLALGIAALFLVLTLRQVDRTALAHALGDIRWRALMLAPGFLALGYACRIQRWRTMLSVHTPGLGFTQVALPFVGSIAVNNLLPFRMGDVMRCVAFSRWLDTPPGTVAATVLVERLLDIIVLFAALAATLWMFSVGNGAVGLGARGAGLLALGSFVALGVLLMPGVLPPVTRAVARSAGAISPRLRRAADGFLQPLAMCLSRLSKRRRLVALVLWSLPVWLFEGATFWAVAQAIPGLDAPGGAWLAMPVGTLSTLLPSTPGHVGTFDYFAQLAMIATGNALATATAFAIVVHLALWLTTTLTGGLCLAVWVWSGNRRVRA